MTIEKLLGLLFEHLMSNEIEWYKVTDLGIQVKINRDIVTIEHKNYLTQYNKIFGYE